MKIVFTCLLLVMVLPFLCNAYTSLTWDQYKTNYAKSYDSSEDADRQAIYDATLATLTDIETKITDQNLGYTVNINEYSDWTVEQLRILMNGVLQLSNPRGDSFSDFHTQKVFRRLLLPSSLTWKNKITGVRKQGKECASAWAFAIAGMCEASVQLKQEDSNNFAEQYLLQCSKSSSCNGGYLQYALERVINSKGMPSEEAFPYNPSTSYNNICKGGSSLTFVSQFSYDFYGLSDSQIIGLLQYGPVAVTLSADGWNHYSGGVYQCSESPSIGHAALIVGYTNTQWIVKNSWGSTWGESGYIRITRTRANNCGIGTAVYALDETRTNAAYLLVLAVSLLFSFLF